MSARHKLFRNAAILTVAGFISRIFGFLFRIFLSRSFGEESVGLYQMIFPLYILCLSLSTAGLQTAVSRITAEKTALGHNKEADGVLTAALCLAVVISLIEILVIQDQAGSIAGSLFGDDRCMELILIISYALPFAAVHSCICGRSLGLGDTMLPAASQLIEQCVRILTVVLLWIFLRTCGLTPSIRLAAAGVVAGEMAAALFTVRGLRLQRPVRAGIRELFAFSAPLTANRTALTLLQSIEAVSIPASLIRYGMSATEAVSLYGVLTGMALPCILFPSALTGSVGTVLLPAVSAASTSGNRRSVFLLLRKAIVSCFSLGLACCLFFLLFGKMIGRFLYHTGMDLSVSLRQFLTSECSQRVRQDRNQLSHQYVRSSHPHRRRLSGCPAVWDPGISVGAARRTAVHYRSCIRLPGPPEQQDHAFAGNRLINARTNPGFI